MAMSAVAMITEPPSRNTPVSPPVRAGMDVSRDFIAWRQNVESFCTSMGCRALLEHVEENRWLFWFTMGQDAQSAVMVELIDVCD